ncbi:hypothetical protein Q5O24_02225 [Eubacteriaceae bacterium ES3]|nr:hypothetical protein Q5O24_02225 [Eubacteriaceae bacterium ES3]
MMGLFKVTAETSYYLIKKEKEAGYPESFPTCQIPDEKDEKEKKE